MHSIEKLVYILLLDYELKISTISLAAFILNTRFIFHGHRFIYDFFRYNNDQD